MEKTTKTQYPSWFVPGQRNGVVWFNCGKYDNLSNWSEQLKTDKPTCPNPENHIPIVIDAKAVRTPEDLQQHTEKLLEKLKLDPIKTIKYAFDNPRLKNLQYSYSRDYIFKHLEYFLGLSYQKILLSFNKIIIPYPELARIMVKRGDINIVRKLIPYIKMDAIFDQDLGYLHYAAIYSHLEMAKLLLEHKANPNIKNINGETPLHYACRYRHTMIINLLIDHGADPNIKNFFDKTPVQVAAENGLEVKLKEPVSCEKIIDQLTINFTEDELKMVLDVHDKTPKRQLIIDRLHKILNKDNVPEVCQRKVLIKEALNLLSEIVD